MEQAAVALLILSLRIVDVSLGTLRVLFTVRGRSAVAASLGVVEAGTFIFAISRVFKHVDSPLAMAGYACGFATGTALGIRLERWIAAGLILVRIISRTKSIQLLASLRQAGFGVTSFSGEGKEGLVLMLFVVAKRKRSGELLRIIQREDPDAFITIEGIYQAMGGYLPHVPGPACVRK